MSPSYSNLISHGGAGFTQKNTGGRETSPVLASCYNVVSVNMLRSCRYTPKWTPGLSETNADADLDLDDLLQQMKFALEMADRNARLIHSIPWEEAQVCSLSILNFLPPRLEYLKDLLSSVSLLSMYLLHILGICLTLLLGKVVRPIARPTSAATCLRYSVSCRLVSLSRPLMMRMLLPRQAACCLIASTLVCICPHGPSSNQTKRCFLRLKTPSIGLHQPGR